MDLDFLNYLPRGKDDKPFLLTQGDEVVFSVDEIDGAISMLEPAFGGCVTIPFSKEIDEEKGGCVTVDGVRVPYVLRPLAYLGGLIMLGARVIGRVNAYDAEYSLCVEGFYDKDGNMMDKTELTIKTPPKTKPLEEYKEHEEIALRLAEEGIVLLKNERNTLPLKPGVLNVLGRGLRLFRTSILGAGRINPRYVVNFRQAVSESGTFSINEELASAFADCTDDLPDEGTLEKARKINDTALVFITRAGGENLECSSAKGSFYLTDEEDKLIAKTAECFERTVVILNVPNPIDISFAEKHKIDALVYSGVGGMLGGRALFNVLSGKANPSGKLTDTWAWDYFDHPSSKNFFDGAEAGFSLDTDAEVWVDTVYEEDIYVGYRYFDTFSKQAAYCFGYGLSYTSFALESISTGFSDKDGLSCKLRVKNTGELSGKEVVQVYLEKPDGVLEQPKRALIAFDKTQLLEPGAAQEILLEIPLRHMTSYDEARAAYVMEKGAYKVYIGASLENAQAAGGFEIEEDLVIKTVQNRMLPVERPQALSKLSPEGSFPRGIKSGVKNDCCGIEPTRACPEHIPAEPKVLSETKLSFSDIVKSPERAAELAAQMTAEELCRLAICSAHSWGMQNVGVAGKIAVPESWELPSFAVSDGNSGVNVPMQNIGFPAMVTCCSTFNKELLEAAGRVLGTEAKRLGVSLMLVPGMNLHRNPLNGRHAEYFSEDPYLTGIMAGLLCRGLEGAGVGGCYKHAVANNCESARKRNQSIITERALREMYFRPFELAMEICMPKSIMTAYNAVNGVFTAADSELIYGLFREECGFDGFVMTDWNSYDSCDIIEMLNGGNNWITPGSEDDKYTSILAAALNDGRLSLNTLREGASYILRAMARLAEAQPN